ncbi:MAG: EpsG family protein [Eubacterium sp.]
MFFYYIPIFVCLFSSFFVRKRVFSILLLFVVSFYLFFILSFKGNVDLDYDNYQMLLDASPYLSDGIIGLKKFAQYYNFEIGLVLLNSSLKSLNLSINAFFAFFAFFSIFSIYKITFNLKSCNKFLVFSLLYIFSFVGLWVQVRFGFACLVAFLSIICFFEKKLLFAFCFLLFAFCFHNIVSSIFIPVFMYIFLNKINFNKNYMLLLLCLFSLLIFVDFSFVLNIVMSFINARYEAYSIEDVGSISSYFVRLVFFTFMLLLAKKDLRFESGIDRFLLSMAFCSVLIFIFATQVTILYRIGVFFEFGYIFFLKRSSYNNQINYIFSLLILITLMIYRALVFDEVVKPYYSNFIG